jgi:hypothetical protein
MAKSPINNPGSILKLWNKAVKTHEVGKDVKTLPKKGQDQKTRIKKGLTTLKFQGATDLTAPANADRFVVLRDKVGKAMTRYCRYLKAAKDEDKKVLPRYLKTVKQLTAVVLKLQPGNVSQGEEDANLDSLEGVDVAEVDRAMEAPDTDGDVNLEESAAKEPPPEEKAPGKPPPAPDAAAMWAERRRKLEPLLQQALTSPRGDADRLRSVFALSDTRADAKNYVAALQSLSALEKLLAAPPPTTATDADDSAARFTARLQALLPQVQKAAAAGVKTAEEAKLRLSEAGYFARKKQFTEGHGLLDQAEQLLSGKPAKPKDDNDKYREMYYGLVSTMPDDLERLKQTDEAAADKIENVVAVATDYEDKGNYKKAFTFLKQAATMLGKALGAGRAGEAAAAIPRGKVATVKESFARARARWDTALAAARAGVKPVQADLQQEYPTAVTGLNNILDSYWKDLIDAIQAGQALQAQGEAQQAVNDVLARVRSLQAEVAGDRLLAYLESCGMKLKSVFVGAFNDVTKLLQA